MENPGNTLNRAKLLALLLFSTGALAQVDYKLDKVPCYSWGGERATNAWSNCDMPRLEPVVVTNTVEKHIVIEKPVPAPKPEPVIKKIGQ